MRYSFLRGFVCLCFQQSPQRIPSKKAGRECLSKLYPHVSEPTIEHVVPTSICGGRSHVAARDLHNLLLLNRRVNNHRQNFRFVNESSSIVALDKQGMRTTLDKAWCWKGKNDRVFIPPIELRGVISRKIAYFIKVYPEWKDTVYRRVISPELMLQWNHDHEVTHQEYMVNEAVCELQGNYNQFVLQPSLVRRVL
jgi:endonuclease I